MNLSIVLPAFNEERIIAQTIEAHLAWVPPVNVVLREIIVVNDGSGDRTAAIVESHAASNPSVQLVSLPLNRGKGAALKQGVAVAGGEIIGCVDADMAYPPALYPDFLQAILEHGADLAIGNRYHSGITAMTRYPLMRRFASRWFKRFTRALGLSYFSDTQCGIKFFRRSAAAFLFRHLQSPGFLYDLELLAMAVHLDLNVHEIPVAMQTVSGAKIKLHRQMLPVAAGLAGLLFRRSAFKSPSLLKKAWIVHNTPVQPPDISETG
jgi:dolichyl-phosphate beta-glucosyltransferase